MTQEIVRREEQAETSVPLHPSSVVMRAKYFSAGAVPTTLLLAYMSQGQIGESAVLGAIAGATLAYFAPEAQKTFDPALRLMGKMWDYLNRNHSGRAKHRLLDPHWWVTGEAAIQYSEVEENSLAELEGPDHSPATQESSSIPERFTIGRETLRAIKEINQKRFVYFGRSSSEQIALPIDSMYHVFDVASSGRGKSNRARTIMMQVVEMAQTYYINPFANTIKAVKDDRKIEVWKPIYERLANRKPIKTGEDIARLLRALLVEIQARNDLEEQDDLSWKDDVIFVFIDELPEVYARCREAPELLDRILRTGRQFGVFCWVFSQTAQVKDIGLSTSAQAQFMTRIYGGGDQTSASRVMKGGVSTDQEKTLHAGGAGLTLMCAEGFAASEYVRAPLLTNEALFAYFGLPPFNLDEWFNPNNQKPTRRAGNLLESDLLPFTLLPSEENHAHFEREEVEERSKTEKGKRVKGPNEEAILDALEALAKEEKPLTLNAIANRAGLTRHQYDEIEAVAEWAGYDIERGKGRPARTEREA